VRGAQVDTCIPRNLRQRYFFFQKGAQAPEKVPRAGAEGE
jgi:hypothetical protein